MSSDNRTLTYIALFVVGALLLAYLTGTMNSDGGETRLSKAAEEIGDGVKNAGRELNPNRTTGDKIGDAVEDLGQDIRDGSDN